MTTLVGVVVDGVGYLAADRMGSVSTSYVHRRKIVNHPDTDLVAFAVTGAPMLAYPAQLIEPPANGGAPDLEWADRYWKRLLDLGSPPLEDDRLDGNLLVLTPGAVTLIGGTGRPTAIGDLGIALGSGGDFALGAFHALRHRDDLDVTTALKQAVRIACHLDTGSGIGVDVLAITSTPTTQEDPS